MWIVLVNMPSPVQAGKLSQYQKGEISIIPSKSCTFSIEKTVNRFSTLLDFEEVGFSKSQPAPKDDFGYTAKISQNKFLSNFGLIPYVAGYLSQIHYKIPDFSEHLLERILTSNLILDDGEENVNNKTCFYDMLHLGTPLNTDNQYVVLPVGMVATNIDANAPKVVKGNYYINRSLFERLDQHNKLGVFMSLVIRDYLQYANIHSGNLGLGVRTLVAAIFSNLKFSDSKYLANIEQNMSRLDTGYLLYWAKNYTLSFNWKKHFFNSIVSIDRPLSGYYIFEYFPSIRYQSFNSYEHLKNICKPLEKNIFDLISTINISLDKINRYLEKLVVLKNRKCKSQFIGASIQGFIFNYDLSLCDSGGTLSNFMHFMDFRGLLRNSAYFSNPRTDIYEEGKMGYAGGSYNEIVKIKLANNNLENIDLSKIINWVEFKASANQFSQKYTELSEIGFQCRNVDFTDLINLRDLKVD